MKYILNWPSGAGGDFILALIAIAKGWNTEIIHLHRLNAWNHKSGSVLKYRTFKYYDDLEKHQELYDNMPDEHVLQTHTLRDLKIKTDSNTVVVNIYVDDIYQETFIGALWKFKTEPIDENEGINHIYKENGFIEGTVNLSYEKLIVQQDETEIMRLFKAFNADIVNIDIIKHALYLYHDKNIKLLQFSHIEKNIDRKAFSDILDMDDLIFSLEQPLRKTIEDQISLREYLPSTGFRIK
jgi:hypothetical protein